jgi:RimJ/RimL family protein N-acetyltransferase
MKRLILTHAFRFVDAVVFRIAPDNLRSRRAIEKTGGILTDQPAEIIFEGRALPHVVYRIDKTDFMASPLWLSTASR